MRFVPDAVALRNRHFPCRPGSLDANARILLLHLLQRALQRGIERGGGRFFERFDVECGSIRLRLPLSNDEVRLRAAHDREMRIATFGRLEIPDRGNLRDHVLAAVYDLSGHVRIEGTVRLNVLLEIHRNPAELRDSLELHWRT